MPKQVLSTSPLHEGRPQPLHGLAQAPGVVAGADPQEVLVAEREAGREADARALEDVLPPRSLQRANFTRTK